MKTLVAFVALAFAAQPAVAQVIDPDQLIVDDVQFVVTDLITDFPDRTEIEDSNSPGLVRSVWIGLYPSLPDSDPIDSLYTTQYQLRGNWSIDPVHGSLNGVGAYIGVTNDHPAWDALTFSTGPASDRIVNAHLNAVSMVLADPSRSALASTALPTSVPPAAFSNGEIALHYGDLFQPGEALVLGRITGVETNPDRDTYRCRGFERPMHRARQLRLDGRQRLNLRATLVDAAGAPVVEADLTARPIVRVLQLGGPLRLRYVMDLPAAEVDFQFDRGRWTYALHGASLPGAGTYLVSMTSPDQNEYVIDAQCRVEITVR